MEKVYSRPSCLDISNNKFCPGCMHSTMVKICMQVLEELELADRAVMVQPIGCANNSSPCVLIDQGCALHGRAPAYATGLKRTNPDTIVFTYQGDGDLTSIGLCEILHAANRGENICVFYINNCNYGMTGGQMSPTTLVGQKTTTCVDGRDPELTGYPMHMAELLATLKGVQYSGRFAVDTPANIRKTKEAVRKAFQNQVDNKGFSFVEVLSNCPTNWGLSPVESVKMLQDKVMKEFPLGVYKDSESEVAK